MSALTKFILVFVGLVFISDVVMAYSHDDVKALITKLFQTNNYNTIVRPTADHSDPVIMFVDMYLVGITDINVKQEKMATTAYLELLWTDDYLTWNKTEHNGIEQLYIPQKDIWKPDIALQNGFTKIMQLGDDFLLVIVDNEGTVHWYPYDVFETTCSIDTANFPFDKQTCVIRFGVWTSPLSDIDVELGSKGILLDHYQPNGEWTIVETSAAATESATEGAIVAFTIVVRRNPQYILYNVILPIIMLSILSVFTFLLPVDSGEKMTFILTLYLAFAVFLTIVSESLPVSATLSLLSQYLIMLLIVGTAIVIVTTFEIRLHYRNDSRKIPHWVKSFVRLSRRLQCRKSLHIVQDVNSIGNSKLSDEKNGDITRKDISKVETIETNDGEETEISWPNVTSAIDFYCFWLFLLITVIGSSLIFGNSYMKS